MQRVGCPLVIDQDFDGVEDSINKCQSDNPLGDPVDGEVVVAKPN